MTRADDAAVTISALTRETEPGARLGSRLELKEVCGVSVGTLHEALRLLQATGEIVVRTGPGGGIFAGESSVLSSLVREVGGQVDAPTEFSEVGRIIRALSPLILADAIAGLDAHAGLRLRESVDALRQASERDLRDVVRASLEVFATLVSASPSGVLRAVVGSILRLQIDLLRRITDSIDPVWREVVDVHVATVSDLVDAILAGDVEAALAVRDRPDFTTLFAELDSLLTE